MSPPLPPGTQSHCLVAPAPPSQFLLLQRLHKVHLLTLLARVQAVAAGAADPDVQAVLLSLIPHELMVARGAPTPAALLPLFRWLRFRFPATNAAGAVAEADSADLGAIAASVSRALVQPVTASQCCALFVCVCAAMGINARVVTALQPVPVTRAVGLSSSKSARGVVMTRCDTVEAAPSTPLASKHSKKRSMSAPEPPPAPEASPALLPQTAISAALLPPSFVPQAVTWTEVFCCVDAEADTTTACYR